MTLPFRSLLIAVAVIAALHTPATANETPTLTKQQVERFLISFDAMLKMVTKYWGDRRFTPHGIIMPHRGTIERAITEMEAEGTIEKFNRLFTSQGFDGYDNWKKISDRIVNAYAQIRAMDDGGAIQQFHPNQIKEIRRKRKALLEPDPQLPDAVRQEQQKSYDRMLAQHERWEIALRDADAVRPFLPQLADLWRRRTNAVKAAKIRKARP